MIDSSQDNSRDVAIIGIGLRLPGKSHSPLELWNNLIKGFDGIVETQDRWSDTFADMSQISSKYAGLLDFDQWTSFDPLHFGINPTDAKEICPQQKLLLKATWEAFEDAQIDPLSLRGSNTSVYIGASSMDYAAVNTDPDKPPINCFNVNLSGVSNRISYCYDFRSESITIDTACSSSLNAVHMGYESIVNNKCDLTVVGGVNFIINPQQSRSFKTAMVTSISGKCKAFDETADGFVRSEGGVVLILKKLSKALQDKNNIYCVIKGSSSNVDGTLAKSNYFAPSKVSQSNNIKQALNSTNGQVNPSDITFVECHGTGTQIGDPIEVEAVSSIFKDVKSKESPLLIGSIKGNIGHLEPASGVASLAKVCLMLKNRQYIKNIHFEKPNPNIKFEEWNVKVVTENAEFPTSKPVSMIINSFGITGSNSCLVLSEYKSTTTSTTNNTSANNNSNNKSYLIPISFSSKSSLEQYKIKLIEYYEKLNLKDLIEFEQVLNYHINSKTTKLASRSVIIAKDWTDIINSCKANDPLYSSKGNKSGNIMKDNNKNPIMVFVFTGLGNQWSQMGRDLYEGEPIFRNSMDKLDSMFTKLFGYSVLAKLRSISDDSLPDIHDFSISQPSIFMLQVSLFELYNSWGIKPSISVGHSFGEISSAYCSGMIDLETACFIVYNRALLQSKTIGSGKLLVVGLSESEYIKEYQVKYPMVEIACYNSPTSIVVSGSEDELNQIFSSLQKKNIFSIILGTPSALHSSKQKVIQADSLNMFKSVKSKLPSPDIKVFSTVTANQFDETTLFDSNYLFDNIRKPVLFEKTISNIFNYIETNDLGSNVIFLEISPNPTLTHYIKEMIPKESNYFYIDDESISVLTSINKKISSSSTSTITDLDGNETIVVLNELPEFQKTISQIYCNGYNVNFKSQLSTSTITKEFTSFYLPHYTWDESSYFKWNRISKQLLQGPSINQLGYRNESSPFISYTSYIDIKEEPFNFLKGHTSRGRYLFPGNGYLENILKIFPNQDITFHLIEYRNPFILREGVKQLISTNIYPSAKNEYRANFHFKDNYGKWVLSAVFRFSVLAHNSDAESQKIDVESIKNKCNWTTIKKKEFYEALSSKTSLSLTDKFQSIQEAYYGYDCCLAKVSMGEDTKLSSYDNELFLNTCTIDGGFQTLGLFISIAEPFVIDKVEYLRFYSNNIPKSAALREQYPFIYTYTEFVSRVGGSIYANVQTFLPDGTLLFNSPVVCFTSISQNPKNEMMIECPNNQLYSTCLQAIESPLPLLNTADSIINNQSLLELIPTPVSNIRKALSTCLFANIKNKYQGITLAKVKSNENDFLISSYFKINENETDKKNLGQSVFNAIKNNVSIIDYSSQSKLIKVLNESQVEVINKITTLLLNETVTEPDKASLSINNNSLINQSQQYLLVEDILTKAITPLVNQKIEFRILEVSNSIGLLSQVIVSKLNLILQQNPLAEIDIEVTFLDHNEDQSYIKEKLTALLYSTTYNETHNDYNKDLSSRKPSLIFKQLNINDKDLISSKSINPSYFDIIIVGTLVDIKDLNQVIGGTIYEVLNPNGYLVVIDTLFTPKSTNTEYELYQQWLSFNYYDSTKSTIDEWKKLLTQDLKFINFTSTTSQPWCIISQKPQYIDTVTKENPISNILNIFDQIIVYGTIDNIDETKAMSKLMDVNDRGTDVYFIKTIEEFEKHVKEIPLTDSSCIVFVNTINIIFFSYISVTMEYIKINQHLLKNNCSAKYILLTRNAFIDSSNVLVNSTVGAFRYFCEFPSLNLYLMDFDDSIYLKSINFINLTYELTDPNKHYQREFIFRDGKIYYERVTQETNLKLKYKSSSYITDPEKLYAKLDSNLNYQPKPFEEIPSGFVEIKILASGINYKDNLVYRRLVPPEAVNHLGNPNDPEFGYECSGIVTRLGEGVTKFKVGDEVVGLGFNCTGSHVVLEDYRFVLKPKSLSHVEAASIPVVYLTSYYSLFVSGNLNLDKSQSVLIHGASGGVGLACINILKAKGFKGLLFVTVGSKEKENYLRVTYGSFITGIYSSKNNDFLFEIKKKIYQETGNNLIFKSWGVSKVGIDLIINTLSNEFMDANFNSLCQGGRIVDLSVTHFNSQDTTDFRKFRYNIGYLSVEILITGFERNKNILQEIMDMFVNENLKLLPIKEYPVSEIKEAIEYISERKHIGKIVVNHENCNLLVSTLFNNDLEFFKDFTTVKPNYRISNDCNLGKTILITGQQGLSFSIIKWIIEYNSIDQPVENIIVLSLSPIKYELEHTIQLCKHMNLSIRIIFKQVDISNMFDLESSIDTIYSENKDLPLVCSIFHNAFAPSECDPLEINEEHLTKSHSAKTMGMVNLNSLSMGRWESSIKNFVVSSSITSILGSQRQCGYVCANAVIDAFSRFRISQSLPILTINWGVLGSTGFVSRHESVSKLFEYQGLLPISIDMIYGTLDFFLQNSDKLNNKIVASFNYSNVSAAFKNHALAYKLNHFINPVISKGSTFDDSELSIREDILDKFSEYLSTEKSKLNLDIKLIDYGSSSMMLVELKNYLDKTYAPNILTITQLQNVSINQLIQHVIQAVSKLKKKPLSKRQLENQSNINWELEISLDPSIVPSNQMIQNYNKSIDEIYKHNKYGGLQVLLTGPITFLGTNLLHNLLLSTKTKSVYCMLALNSAEEVLEKIIENFKVHDIKLTQQELSKIIPIPADFTRPIFGLDGDDYIDLSKKVDLVINAASNTTKHYCAHISYEDTNKEYLNGVGHLIRFSCSERIKRLVQISTMGRYSDKHRDQLDEYYFPTVDFSFIADQNTLVSGYIQSKIVAEYHLKQAANRGIPCTIIRIPFTFTGANGVGREVDFTQLLLQSCYILNSYPSESHVYLYTAPVTWHAKNITLLSVGSDISINGCWDQNTPIENLFCFNLFGGGFNFGDLLFEISKDLGWKEIPFDRLVKAAAQDENEPCKKLASFVLKKKGEKDFIKNLGVIPSFYNVNPNLQKYLELNNSFNGWLITKELVYAHLSYVFKKKIIIQ